MLAAVVTTVAILAMASTPAFAGHRQDAVRAAAQELVRQGFPAVVVYVRDGTRERRVAAGKADMATGEPATAQHRFRIASNTKAFTATVVLQLVGEGRLSLSDTLADVLPGVVRGGGYEPERITVRQLLEHSSGIHDPLDPHFFDPYLVDQDRGHVYPPREVIRRSLVDPPSFPPGAKTGYSNTGYLLLGLIIERVTGNAADWEIRDRILRPLHLNRTTFPLIDPYIHGRHLHGYDLTGQDMSVFSPSYDWTAGAMMSTVDDLADFHRALFGGRLLAPREQRLLREAGPDGHHALGVETGPLRCPGRQRTIWGNTGAGPGYLSVSMTTADGTRQVVLVATTFDLAAELRDEPTVPASPMPAVVAGLCS